MPSRRTFMKTLALAAGGAAADTVRVLGARGQTGGYFGLHPFVENHPDAVFVMQTNVEKKTDAGAIRDAALSFSRSVFWPKSSGLPLTTSIPIKPNLACSYTAGDRFSLEYGMGIVTDPNFVEGVIEGMKELGLPGNQFFIREVNCPTDFGPRGYTSMAERTGAEIRDMSGTLPFRDKKWKDVPDGIWFKKIPYLAPAGAPDSFLVNIAKFKASGMGMSLCAKNLQGLNIQGYQTHCTPYERSMLIDAAHWYTDTAKTAIQTNYNRHVAQGIPRWDRPQGEAQDGGLWMETWATRCIDNNSAITAGLHVIEGVYGRDGNGDLWGPNPPGNENSFSGEAWDHMTNVVMFGLNPFHVDIVGHWMAGHEPGNFGLFHLAKERGRCKVLNPARIPIYLWAPGEFGVKAVTPADLPRTPLKTNYLQQNYRGGAEPLYHLCDEPFEYPDEPIGVREERPRAFVLSQNHPNPFNPSTSIEFALPEAGTVLLEVFNAAGQRVAVLAEGRFSAGAHLAVWNTAGHASGTYFYRLRFGGFGETRKMTLVK